MNFTRVLSTSWQQHHQEMLAKKEKIDRESWLASASHINNKTGTTKQDQGGRTAGNVT